MARVLHKFTRSIPDWRPRVEPIKLDEANSDQLEALQITPSNTKVSDYVLTLAHDVESLKVRSPLFNAIMYDDMYRNPPRKSPLHACSGVMPNSSHLEIGGEGMLV